MKQGDRFINGFTLDAYTYDSTDSRGNIVLINKNNEVRQVGERYFESRYLPYSEEVYKQLKCNKKVGVICEKSVEDLDLDIAENVN